LLLFLVHVMSVALPVFLSPAFSAGLVLSLSLIMAIGPQNAHVLRMGVQRHHLWLTVAVCVLADAVLIAFGVWGLGQVGHLSDRLHGALLGAGVLFLLAYGWRAARRCWRGTVLANPVGGVTMLPATVGRWQAVGMALAFSWLNPHAWLDTALLLGTASLANGAAGNAAFGAGAVLASLLWFVALGVAASGLGRCVRQDVVWRLLDGLVALMMWGVALALLRSLL
jgi:L-lysine exporter family protein LysE/ArgO